MKRGVKLHYLFTIILTLIALERVREITQCIDPEGMSYGFVTDKDRLVYKKTYIKHSRGGAV